MTNKQNIIATLLIMLVISAMVLNNGKDTSDSPNGWSGLTVHLDYQTGCHYLTRRGGLTPRLDRSGNHICDGSAVK